MAIEIPIFKRPPPSSINAAIAPTSHATTSTARTETPIEIATKDYESRLATWREWQPVAAAAFQDVMGVPAWKSLPTWFMVAMADEAIPPEAERQFAARMGATTIEVASSHVAMVSHPDEVAQLIETAAKAVQARG